MNFKVLSGRAALFLIGSILCAVVRADPQSEARDLKQESLKILKATADRDATPIEMATCIFNLEKAARLLESAHDSNSDLATEINSELYWARKRSTLAVDAALDKLKGTSGSAAPVAKKAAVELNATTEAEDARKAFQEGEAFARSHTDDDYVVSLHWFRVAGSFPGSDYSLKALSLGREAQERFKSKTTVVKVEDIPDSPEMKPLRDADELAKSKRYDKAIPLYLTSLKIKETLVAHRKLGQAYFNEGQVVWEDLIKRRDALAKALNDAKANAFMTIKIRGVDRKVRNPNDPTLIAAQKKCAEFDKECDADFAIFDKARDEFRAVLRMTPSGKDLIAAGFIGLCMSRKTSQLFSAKSQMALFLKDYTPANDDERGIYEFCKTELERFNKIAGK